MNTSHIETLAHLNNTNCFKTALVIPNSMLYQDPALEGVVTHQDSHLFNFFYETSQTDNLQQCTLNEIRKLMKLKPFCIELSNKVSQSVHELVLSFNPKMTSKSTKVFCKTPHSIQAARTNPKDATFKRIESDQDLNMWLECFERVWPGYGDTKKAFQKWLSCYGYSKDLPFQNFLLLHQNKPCGIASLFFDSGGVGPFNIAIIPEMQKKGLGMILMKHLLSAIQDNKCQYIVGSASDEGLKLYSKFDVNAYGITTRYFFN